LTALESFNKIAVGQADFEDKINFWRSVIELRRIHNTVSTDTIIKSIIESKGVLTNANALLASNEYCTRNSSNIAVDVRKLFQPNTNELSLNNIHKEQVHGRVNTIKLLRNRRQQQQQQQRKCELIALVAETVDKTYYVNPQNKNDKTVLLHRK
jgi:hypothetical protein